MIEHTFRTITLRYGEHTKQKRILKFADERYGILTEFFASEADSFRRQILDAVEPVQRNEETDAAFAGNKYGFSVFNDEAVIFDQLEDPIRFCQLPFEDFWDLLAEWYGLDQEEEKENEEVCEADGD